MIVLDLTNAGPLVGDLRRLVGVTRTELAQRIATARGIEPKPLHASLSMWEAGKRNPDTTTLALILDVLDLDVTIAPRVARPVGELARQEAIAAAGQPRIEACEAPS